MRQRPSNAATCPCPWQIHSVSLKARDGPERLAQVYQLLLQPRPFPHPDPTASRPSKVSVHRVSQAKEHSDASGDLRTRLHPTPGT